MPVPCSRPPAACPLLLVPPLPGLGCRAGTGKVHGDRHPKISDNVLIGASASILGNIRVGKGAQVGGQACAGMCWVAAGARLWAASWVAVNRGVAGWVGIWRLVGCRFCVCGRDGGARLPAVRPGPVPTLPPAPSLRCAGLQVAAGSLVLKPVPPRTLVAGSPAKEIGTIKGGCLTAPGAWLRALAPLLLPGAAMLRCLACTAPPCRPALLPRPALADASRPTPRPSAPPPTPPFRPLPAPLPAGNPALKMEQWCIDTKEMLRAHLDDDPFATTPTTPAPGSSSTRGGSSKPAAPAASSGSGGSSGERGSSRDGGGGGGGGDGESSSGGASQPPREPAAPAAAASNGAAPAAAAAAAGPQQNGSAPAAAAAAAAEQQPPQEQQQPQQQEEQRGEAGPPQRPRAPSASSKAAAQQAAAGAAGGGKGQRQRDADGVSWAALRSFVCRLADHGCPCDCPAVPPPGPWADPFVLPRGSLEWCLLWRSGWACAGGGRDQRPRGAAEVASQEELAARVLHLSTRTCRAWGPMPHAWAAARRRAGRSRLRLPAGIASCSLMQMISVFNLTHIELLSSGCLACLGGAKAGVRGSHLRQQPHASPTRC